MKEVTEEYQLSGQQDPSGIEIDDILYNLSLTPFQRLQKHNAVIVAAEKIRGTVITARPAHSR